MLSYDHLQFRYEPFPIGIAKPVMPDARYGELVANFPPVELFESFEQMGKKGRKFTLSPKENAKKYNDFVQGNPLWREFHQWIKSRDFVYGALDMLAGHGIDLGYRYVPPGLRAVRMIPGAGHMVQLEAPAEVNAILLEFLADIRAGG